MQEQMYKINNRQARTLQETWILKLQRDWTKPNNFFLKWK